MAIVKRIKPFGWFALSVLFFIIICLLFLLFTHSSHASKQTTHNTRENHQILKNFASNEALKNTPGIYLHTEITNGDTYSSLIRYPYTMIEGIDAPIQEWIANEEEQFMKKRRYEKSNIPAHFTIQFDINKLAKKIYNLTAISELSLGDEKHTRKESFTIDLSSGRQLTLDDIFLNSSNPSFQEFIVQEIQTLIADETTIQQYINDSLDGSINDVNWSLTPEYLIIFSREFEDQLVESNPNHIQIPIQKIAHFVKNQWLEPLDLTDEIAYREESRQKENEVAATPDVHKDLNGKYIALTFDDGPHPDVTPRILETLDTYDAKATFFMLGLQVEKNPDLATDVANHGHEIANHSQTHKDLTTLNYEQLQREIRESNQTIHQITGQKPSLYRPPFGSYNEHIEQIIKENGLSIMLWSVDSLDWKNRNQQTITSTVTAHATVDSTILMHDIHPTTADALPNIMEQLSRDGYEFVTVSELLAIQEERNKNEAF